MLYFGLNMSLRRTQYVEHPLSSMLLYSSHIGSIYPARKAWPSLGVEEAPFILNMKLDVHVSE